MNFNNLHRIFQLRAPISRTPRHEATDFIIYAVKHTRRTIY